MSGYFFYANPQNLSKDNRGQYLFESPGVYRIKVTFEDFDGKLIESNVVTIEAKEPKGEDAEAYKYLKNLQDNESKKVYYGNFLLLSYEHPEVFEKQEEFISKFQGSKYARLLYYAIGLRFTSQEYLQSKENQKTVQCGIEYLEKAANYKDFFLAKDSILHLIETLSKLGEVDKAKKYKEIFAKQFPNSIEGRDYIEEVAVVSEQKKQPHVSKPLGVVLPAAVGIAVVLIGIGGILLYKKKSKPRKP